MGSLELEADHFFLTARHEELKEEHARVCRQRDALVKVLEKIAESNGIQPGHVAYMSKAEICRLANYAALAAAKSEQQTGK